MKLEYFGAHGRCLSIRMMLELGKQEFEDIKLDPAAFGANKGSGKYKFGQVPVLTLEDGTELYQSYSIMRYLGQTLTNGSMYPAGKDAMLSFNIECALAKDESIIGKYIGFLVPFLPFYKDKDTHFTNFVTEHFPKYLEHVEGLLSKSAGKYLFNDDLTIADFSTFGHLFKLCLND